MQAQTPSARSFLQEQSSYFWLYSLALFAALFLLSQLDKGDAILYFAERRTEAANLFFRLSTSLVEGWALLAMLLVLALRHTGALLSFLLLCLLCLFAVGASKMYFSQPRPLVYFEEVLGQAHLLSFVEGVEPHGSRISSFPSGHTTMAFASGSFFAFLLRNKLLKLLFFCLALSVAVSRIYLVQHFLEDVSAGAVLGLCIAILSYIFFLNIQQRAWAKQGLRQLLLQRKTNK